MLNWKVVETRYENQKTSQSLLDSHICKIEATSFTPILEQNNVTDIVCFQIAPANDAAIILTHTELYLVHGSELSLLATIDFELTDSVKIFFSPDGSRFIIQTQTHLYSYQGLSYSRPYIGNFKASPQPTPTKWTYLSSMEYSGRAMWTPNGRYFVINSTKPSRDKACKYRSNQLSNGEFLTFAMETSADVAWVDPKPNSIPVSESKHAILFLQDNLQIHDVLVPHFTTPIDDFVVTPHNVVVAQSGDQAYIFSTSNHYWTQDYSFPYCGSGQLLADSVYSQESPSLDLVKVYNNGCAWYLAPVILSASPLNKNGVVAKINGSYVSLYHMNTHASAPPASDFDIFCFEQVLSVSFKGHTSMYVSTNRGIEVFEFKNGAWEQFKSFAIPCRIHTLFSCPSGPIMICENAIMSCPRTIDIPNVRWALSKFNTILVQTEHELLEMDHTFQIKKRINNTKLMKSCVDNLLLDYEGNLYKYDDRLVKIDSGITNLVDCKTPFVEITHAVHTDEGVLKVYNGDELVFTHLTEPATVLCRISPLNALVVFSQERGNLERAYPRPLIIKLLSKVDSPSVLASICARHRLSLPLAMRYVPIVNEEIVEALLSLPASSSDQLITATAHDVFTGSITAEEAITHLQSIRDAVYDTLSTDYNSKQLIRAYTLAVVYQPPYDLVEALRGIHKLNCKVALDSFLDFAPNLSTEKDTDLVVSAAVRYNDNDLLDYIVGYYELVIDWIDDAQYQRLIYTKNYDEAVAEALKVSEEAVMEVIAAKSSAAQRALDLLGAENVDIFPKIAATMNYQSKTLDILNKKINVTDAFTALLAQLAQISSNSLFFPSMIVPPEAYANVVEALKAGSLEALELIATRTLFDDAARELVSIGIEALKIKSMNEFDKAARIVNQIEKTRSAMNSDEHSDPKRQKGMLKRLNGLIRDLESTRKALDSEDLHKVIQICFADGVHNHVDFLNAVRDQQINIFA